MERGFKRDITSLEGIFAFIEQFISSNGIAPSHLYPVQLVIEELFTNILKYQSGGTSDVVVHLEKSDNKLIIRLRDFDSEPFDLTKSGDINTDEYIEQKKPGGLGIHLVKQMVDSLDYEYNNRTSTITLIKHLER
jgi:anti-sigma regulatory factor (Ser/Thr protein kinase)